MELAESLLLPAISGDAQAVRALVAVLTPVIQARAARSLSRRPAGRTRDARQEVGDMTQDVLLLLFRDDARVLRAWQAERGLSLLNYVGLVAEREVGHISRSGRRSPWSLEPVEDAVLDAAPSSLASPESQAGSRDLFDRLHARLLAELNSRAVELYRMLVVEDLSVAEVMERTSLSADAVYAWRSRLLKRVRELLVELEAPVVSETSPTPTIPGYQP